jgi:hypothetical protein
MATKSKTVKKAVKKAVKKTAKKKAAPLKFDRAFVERLVARLNSLDDRIVKLEKAVGFPPPTGTPSILIPD